MTALAKRYRAVLVSHTHWDRAWYCTFQEYRVRLVRLIDRLLSILDADPAYTVYMLDGQMSVLDDYLEARPGNAARLQAYTRSGRIVVGPWFVLADEFLVSPESLIRDLRLGHKLGEAYGGVMKIGYVPDGFGHIAQLPQLLRGFNIDNAFFWRGMGVEGDRLGTEFIWRAPDGSEVTAILMPWGYHNVSNMGYAIHWGDTSQMEFDAPMAQDYIRRAVDKLTPMANTPSILLMNGIDHAEPEPRIPAVIREANERLDDVEIVQGTLADHLAAVRASGVPLEAFEGEFRWGRYSEILQGVYSARIHIKQINHAEENRLERYLEPLTAMAWLSGAPVPDGTSDLVALAWRWLLLNHPHDDMYGCGIDEVHHEMLYRFSQSRQIADALIRDSLRQIALQADMTAQTGTPIIVYNPLGWARHEVVEAVVDFEFDDPTPDNFHVVDGQGRVVPHQVISDEQAFWMEVLKANRKRRVTVLLLADVPACGYTTLYAKAGAAPTTPESRLQVGARSFSNGLTQLVVEADGGLSVTDMASGETYPQLGHFYDAEDAGDAYSSCPFRESEIISTVGGAATVTLVERGPLRASFRIERTLNVPKRLSGDRQSRSAETVALPIVSTVSVIAGKPGVYVRTSIDNAAEDHKLTVNFPSPLRVESAFVDESFLIAERSLTLPDSTGWVEDPSTLMHQRSFTDLSDGERGLAVLNRGLPSVEVRPEGEIALTLLRCVGWLSRDDLWVRRIAAGPLVPTPGAQCQGHYDFEYAILPHAGDSSQVYPHAYNYDVPLMGRRADTHPGLELSEMNVTKDDPALVKKVPWPRGGSMPESLSYVAVEPKALVLSAFFRSGDDVIVRLYNISREPVRGTVRLGFPVASAALVNMLHETLAPLSVTDGAVEIDAKGAEVITIRLTPRP